MKQVVAIVKPFVAEKVVMAVCNEQIDEILVREVKGYGRQKNYLDKYGDNLYSLAFLPKVEIHVWVADEYAEKTIELMLEASRSDALGDGKILVLSVDESIHF